MLVRGKLLTFHHVSQIGYAIEVHTFCPLIDDLLKYSQLNPFYEVIKSEMHTSTKPNLG